MALQAWPAPIGGPQLLLLQVEPGAQPASVEQPTAHDEPWHAKLSLQIVTAPGLQFPLPSQVPAAVALVSVQAGGVHAVLPFA